MAKINAVAAATNARYRSLEQEAMMPNPVMLKPIVAIAMLAALTGCASGPMPVSAECPGMSRVRRR